MQHEYESKPRRGKGASSFQGETAAATILRHAAIIVHRRADRFPRGLRPRVRRDIASAAPALTFGNLRAPKIEATTQRAWRTGSRST